MSLWRRMLLDNLALKLISLLLASLLWYQVASRQMVERVVAMPVDVENLPENLAIANQYPRSVQVLVRTIRDSTPENLGLSVVLDLDKRGSGKWVETTPQIPGRPANLEPVRFVNPPVIELYLEDKIRSSKPVEIDLDGEPAPDFEVVGQAVMPQEVWVSGPRSAVEALDSVKTIPISVENRNTLLSREVTVFSEDDRVIVQGNPKVSAVVNIEEKRREFSLNLPVEVTPPDPGAQLVTKQLRISGSVPVTFPGTPDVGDFRLTVSTRDLEPRRESYDLVPQLEYAEGLEESFRLSDAPLGLVKVRKRQ